MGKVLPQYLTEWTTQKVRNGEEVKFLARQTEREREGVCVCLKERQSNRRVVETEREGGIILFLIQGCCCCCCCLNQQRVWR